MENFLIEKQLATTIPLTEEILNKLSVKNYTSGRAMQIGDQVLYGILRTDSISNNEIKINFIQFHIDELGVIYEVDQNYISDTFEIKLPYLNLINNGN